MDNLQLFSMLEKKIELLLERYAILNRENERLKEQNLALSEERRVLKSSIDAILAKLEGI